MVWRPAHETHAIERVNFSLSFTDPIPMKRWQQLLDECSPTFQKASFVLVPIQDIPFGVQNIHFIVGHGSPVNIALPSSSDRAYTLVEGSEAREEARLSRKTITYGTIRYLGWERFKTRINELLGHLIEDGLSLASPQTIKLEYWDRFTSDGEPSNCSYQDLLKNHSSYVSGFAQNASDLWHSHIGYFTPHATAKRLINLNIDVADVAQPAPDGEGTEQHRSAGLYSMAQDTFPEQLTDTFGFRQVLSHLDQMHSILKNLLGDVITEHLSERISLFGESKG